MGFFWWLAGRGPEGIGTTGKCLAPANWNPCQNYKLIRSANLLCPLIGDRQGKVTSERREGGKQIIPRRKGSLLQDPHSLPYQNPASWSVLILLSISMLQDKQLNWIFCYICDTKKAEEAACEQWAFQRRCNHSYIFFVSLRPHHHHPSEPSVTAKDKVLYSLLVSWDARESRSTASRAASRKISPYITHIFCEKDACRYHFLVSTSPFCFLSTWLPTEKRKEEWQEETIEKEGWQP